MVVWVRCNKIQPTTAVKAYNGEEMHFKVYQTAQEQPEECDRVAQSRTGLKISLFHV